jgi:hypothetical protein
MLILLRRVPGVSRERLGASIHPSERGVTRQPRGRVAKPGRDG